MKTVSIKREYLTESESNVLCIEASDIFNIIGNKLPSVILVEPVVGNGEGFIFDRALRDSEDEVYAWSYWQRNGKLSIHLLND